MCAHQGEITPRSTLGRICTVPLLAFGLLLIALPSFVLGRNFSLVWDHLRNADQGMIYPRGDDRSARGSLDDEVFSSEGTHEGGETRGSGRSSTDLTPLPTTANGYTSVAGGQSTGLSTLPMGSPDASTTARKRVRVGPASTAGAGSDLTNMKLARNQEALSAQIDGLRETVEGQGRLIGRLLEALEEKGKKDERGGVI